MVTTTCNALLAKYINPDESALWLAAETSEGFSALAHFSKLGLITNRADIFHAAKSLNITAELSDWAINPQTPINAAFYRVSKEKLTNFYIANQVMAALPAGGRFVLCGHKNDGLKTFAKKVAAGANTPAHIEKHKDLYIAEIIQGGSKFSPLNDEQYESLRAITHQQDKPVLSKPGIYGWNKIDSGSQLLVNTLQERGNAHPDGGSLLDLGCGYGYLTLATSQWNAPRRVATDNNIAAVKCMAQNAQGAGLNVEAILDDCGQTIDERFDTLLCNPPFHTGFDVNSALTNRFLEAANNKLKTKGTAYFVVNSFIPIEKKAATAFGKIHTLANNKQFKVLALSQPLNNGKV